MSMEEKEALDTRYVSSAGVWQSHLAGFRAINRCGSSEPNPAIRKILRSFNTSLWAELATPTRSYLSSKIWSDERR